MAPPPRSESLRARFAEPGAAFLLELLECSEVDYAPYQGDTTSPFDEIARATLDLLEAKHEDGRVLVWGSEGVLRLP